MSNDIRDRLQETARAVEVTLPPGTGFIVLAFDFGSVDGRRLEYVSNVQREDVLKIMEKFAAHTKRGWMKHLDDGPPAPGTL